MTMAQILTNVGDIVTALVGWIGQFASAITSNPIILIFVIVGLVFLGLNGVRKLMRV